MIDYPQQVSFLITRRLYFCNNNMQDAQQQALAKQPTRLLYVITELALCDIPNDPERTEYIPLGRPCSYACGGRQALYDEPQTKIFVEWEGDEDDALLQDFAHFE